MAVVVMMVAVVGVYVVTDACAMSGTNVSAALGGFLACS